MAHEQEAGDQIDAQGSQGFIHRPQGSVKQDFHYHCDEAYNVRDLANPYLGLAPFTYQDRASYAGRETQIAITRKQLTNPEVQRVLLFIMGASGSGKSSFAQAGLIPALEKYYAQYQYQTRYALLRPSKQPLLQLCTALHQQIQLPNFGWDHQPDAFYAFIQQHTPSHNINLIVIDQFEELFTQSDPIQRDILINLFSQTPPFAKLRTHFIITMRTDYLPELFQHQSLYEMTKHGVDLRVMTSDELKCAIQRPLLHSHSGKGIRFEDGLLDRLATDAGADAAYLPLLQVTLGKLWNGGRLKLDAYGTLTDAVQDHAEQVALSIADQETMLAIFLALVKVSLDDDTRRDTRRRRTITEVTQGNSERAVLVETLCQFRLLSKDIEEHEGHIVDVVDIIHESLLTKWSRLHDGIKSERDRLQQRERFEWTLHEWQNKKYSNDYLLHGVRLSEAQALDTQGDVALQRPVAQEFLRRSIVQRQRSEQAELERQKELTKAQQQRASLLQQALVIVSALSGVIFALAIIGLIATGIASTQREAAEQEAQARATAQAIADQNATEARKSLALTLATTASTWQNADEALVLALAAVRLDETTPRIQRLASDSITEYALEREYLGHESWITSVAFSPDGMTALSGSSDTTLRLWDLATGETIRIFEGHTNGVNSIAFSPDGATALSGSSDNTLHLWEVATGKTIRIFEGHTDQVWDVAFSPDGTMALSGSVDDTLHLWEVATGKTIRIFEGHTDQVWDVAFSPDGTMALSGSVDDTLRLWDVATGEALRAFHGHNDSVNSVTFSPDGQKALSVALRGSLRIWDTRPLVEIADEVCAERYIVPETEAAMREQFAIPEDVVLCPGKQPLQNYVEDSLFFTPLTRYILPRKCSSTLNECNLSRR